MEGQICTVQIYKHPNNNRTIVTLNIILVAFIIWSFLIISHRSCKL